MTISNQTDNSSKKLRSSAGVQDNLLFLLVGGGIGATLALLFAPKPGAELRSNIADASRKGLDQTREFANTVKEQSTELYQNVRIKAEEALDLASSKFAKARDGVEDAFDQTAEHINGEILDMPDAEQQRNVGSGRRSSNIV